MDPLVIKKRRALEGLCADFRVQRLELFGSAAKGDGVSVSSDLDFLIEFQEMEPREYADAYFEFLHALTALFESPVDLIVLSAITDPYFLRSIERTRTHTVCSLNPKSTCTISSKLLV